MNREEHLLTIFIEECAELAQAASKAQRFGPGDRKTLDPSKLNSDESQPTNAERMAQEFNDILALIPMLYEANKQHYFMLPDPEHQKRKREKVERYLEYSKRVGTLQETPNDPT